MSLQRCARALLVLGSLLLAPAARAGGEGGGAPKKEPARPVAEPVAEKEAKAALAAYDLAAKDAAGRPAALRTLTRSAHPLIGDRLLRIATTANEDAGLRTEAFLALVDQKDSAARLATTAARFVGESVKEMKKATARGDFGFPMDRKTGDPILDTVEGKAAMAAKRARGRMLAAAVGLLKAWGHHTPDFAEDLRDLLQDGTDELVVECLRILAERKDADALPRLLDLFEMYPSETKWATGASVDRGGTNASAKAAWMGRFGDPDKRRPRPLLVKALKEAVLAITGQAQGTPEELRTWMESRKGNGRGNKR